MVLPTAPPASLSVSQILTEFGIAAGTQKRLSNDLFPLVGGTAGATCSLAASFSGKSNVPSYKNGINYANLGLNINNIAVDSNKNIYIVGSYSGNPTIYNFTTNLNGPTSSGYAFPNNVSGVNYGFIIKYNAAGVYQSSMYMTGVGYSTNFSYVAVDSSGNIYISGYHSGPSQIYNLTTSPNSSFTGYSMSSTTYYKGFLLKYNSSGTYQGCFEMSTDAGDAGFIACGPSNEVYFASASGHNGIMYNLTGAPNSSSSGYTFNSTGNNLLVKWNSSGTYQYATVIPFGQGGFPAVCCDSNGNAYWSIPYGSSSPTIYNMTANPNTSSTGYSLPGTYFQYSGSALIMYNSSGSYIRSTALFFTSSFSYFPTGPCICDSLNNVYWLGNSRNGPAIYNMAANPTSSPTGYSIASAGGSDQTNIIKFNSSGSYVGASSIFLRVARYISIGPNNEVLIGGGSLGSGATIYNITTNPNSVSSGYTIPGGGYFNSYYVCWDSSGNYKYGTVITDATGGSACQPTGAVFQSSNVIISGSYSTSPIVYQLSAAQNTISSGYSLTTTAAGAFANWQYIIKYG